MSSSINRQVRLVKRPIGIPLAEHFELVDAQIPKTEEGQVRIRNVYLSIEPAMRGWVNAVGNYSEPVAIGAVMRSFAAGVVEESRSSHIAVGDWVAGIFGWQEVSVVDASEIEQVISERDLPLSTALGVLGINGVTAHYGLLQIGEPRADETVVVSTAAGAVGSCVGQIAKIKGCRTVGITGGRAKRQLCLDEYGFDAAIDYKAADFEEQLRLACPNGVDVYFDNTAGAISDAVAQYLNPGARIIVCGTASVSNWDPVPTGPRMERTILVNRIRMQGFVIFDHPDYYSLARRELAHWIREGRLSFREDILEGLECAPDSIAGLYRGENLGKRLIKIGEIPSRSV